MRKTVVVASAATLLLLACSADKRPPSSPAREAPADYGTPSPSMTHPPGAQPPAQAPPPAGGFAEPPPGGRAAALSRATSEIEAAQRELDVAAGDCRNACRALRSMDRAAGRICELATGAEESRRCEDAKQKLYSARDRIRSTCGVCSEGPSLERSAPVPSLR